VLAQTTMKTGGTAMRRAAIRRPPAVMAIERVERGQQGVGSLSGSRSPGVARALARQVLADMFPEIAKHRLGASVLACALLVLALLPSSASEGGGRRYWHLCGTVCSRSAGVAATFFKRLSFDQAS